MNSYFYEFVINEWNKADDEFNQTASYEYDNDLIKWSN